MKVSNPQFRIATIRMSQKAMADLLYACIMCDAEITDTFGIGIKQYDRSQNAYNRVDVMVKLEADDISKFELLSHVTLHESPKIQLA